MPNRIIKESVNESRGISSCTFFAQDLFKRLITYADDYGRFNADTEIMRARLYPRDLEIVTEQDIVDALIELCGVEKIQFYTSNPRKEIYGCFPKWEDHQRVRDSKTKCPDPDDTTINDWYLRRFVSIDMKAKILERDGFKCQVCGKFLTSCRDAKRFVKLGSGLYHIDHLVPCNMGGRATLENLRLTCPTCNLTRKRKFTFEEIVSFSDSPQVSADGGESPQDAARACEESNPNPIQSESKTKSSSRSKKFIPPTLEEVTAYCKERSNAVDPKRFYDYFTASDWVDSAGKPVKSWKQKVITWEGYTNSKGGTTDGHNQHGGSTDGTTTKWGNLSTRILG